MRYYLLEKQRNEILDNPISEGFINAIEWKII
jgi:hypothetical protein